MKPQIDQTPNLAFSIYGSSLTTVGSRRIFNASWICLQLRTIQPMASPRSVGFRPRAQFYPTNRQPSKRANRVGCRILPSLFIGTLGCERIVPSYNRRRTYKGRGIERGGVVLDLSFKILTMLPHSPFCASVVIEVSFDFASYTKSNLIQHYLISLRKDSMVVASRKSIPHQSTARALYSGDLILGDVGLQFMISKDYTVISDKLLQSGVWYNSRNVV